MTPMDGDEEMKAKETTARINITIEGWSDGLIEKVEV